MQPSLVSVVIPVYNGQRYLRETLASVLAQTYPRLEVIAVNDGSTDDSGQILASYGERVTVIEQANAGVGAARNAGIVQARGEFIALLDQDDWWEPEKVEKQVAVFQADARIGLVHTGIAYFDNVTQSFRGPLCPWFRPELAVGDCFERMLLENPLTNSSVMVRRSVLDQIGLCDRLSMKNSCQDYDLWLRIARVSRFGYVPETLTTYRLHPNQGIWDRRAMVTDVLLVLRRALGREGDAIPERLRGRFADLYEELAIAHLDMRDRPQARACLGRAYRIVKSRRRAVLWTACCLPDFLLFPLRRWRERLRKAAGASQGANLPEWSDGKMPETAATR